MKLTYQHWENKINLEKRDSVDFEPHLHKAVEIISLLSGSAFCSVDGETFEIKQGDTVVAFPNQIHSYWASQNITSYVIILDASIFPEFKKIFKQKPVCPIIGREQTEKNGFFNVMETVFKEYNSCSPAVQKGWLTVALGKLFEVCECVSCDKVYTDFVGDILSYCENNYHEKLSLGTAAKALHISESRLSHIFSEKFKMSFPSYINMLRINEACIKLAETDLSITEIADLCGFSTIRTFNRAFLKQVGVSPVKYRREV